MPLSSEQAAFLKRVGSNVRRQRTRQKLTQAKLAELAELDTRTIQKIEAGDINLLITTVGRLKAALDARWDSLLD